MSHEEYVIKRNGEKETVSFDKILNRVKNMSKKDNLNINFTSLCVKIIDRLYDSIPTSEIDELTAQQCASLATTHPDYGTLASRILISNHQKIPMKILLLLYIIYITLMMFIICIHLLYLNHSII